MSKYWSQKARELEPYVPGEQPKDRKFIKLNTNENPYPPSPKVLEAIKNAADDSLRLYPQPNCDELRETIAEYYKLNKEQVFVGNGSDELLAFAFMAFFDPDRPILFADITYSFYPVYADLFSISYETVSLNEDFEMQEEGFYRENGGIIIANPNAPTSKMMPLEAIKRIIEKNSESVVIIDEAYVDFGGESAVGLVGQYPNLLVINTLSKSRSLAGLRVGFALGNAELIQGLDRVKNSFNSYTLDRLALAGAVEALRDTAYFEQTRGKIIKTREWVSGKLKDMGFKVEDSKANFIFASHNTVPAIELFKKLGEKGILVRYFNKPKINNYLRISIGTDEEMESVIKALEAIL